MGFDTIIANGKVVTATDTYLADIAISAGKIEVVGQNLPRQNAARVLEAMGKYVLPGGSDVHTHLDMPFGGTTSADDFETGTRAAAFGGTTSIVDFAIQYRGQTLHHAWETWMKKAESKAVIDYGFHMIITELTDQVEGEMDALVRQGVTSFKLFMAYRGVFMLDDGSIFKALSRTGRNGGTVCMHAENGDVIDVLVQRALAFNDLQCVSTDHCPFCMKEQKELGRNDFSKIPNGAPGIETRMSLVYDGGVRTGRISLNRFVELTSTSPAKIFGLFPRKGTIAPGSDADIVVFDPNRTMTLSARTLHMKVDYNPYEGRQVTGATDTVLSRGRLVIENGQFVGRPGSGVFVKRGTRS